MTQRFFASNPHFWMAAAALLASPARTVLRERSLSSTRKVLSSRFHEVASRPVGKVIAASNLPAARSSQQFLSLAFSSCLIVALRHRHEVGDRLQQVCGSLHVQYRRCKDSSSMTDFVATRIKQRSIYPLQHVRVPWCEEAPRWRVRDRFLPPRRHKEGRTHTHGPHDVPRAFMSHAITSPPGGIISYQVNALRLLRQSR
jgi:hypothetical protein